MKFILASASPRRKEILTKAGFDFEIKPSNYDEKITKMTYSTDLVENCSYNKALDVFQNNKNLIIVSADTVVVLEDIILGKPKDKNDAILTLEKLSNKTHFVSTSICILNKNVCLKATDKTFVTFRKLSKTDIINYIEHSKPFDKAGSYGIQDDGFDFCINIKGELDNVIGFPLKLFKKMINEMEK